jgi:hypothetical protein
MVEKQATLFWNLFATQREYPLQQEWELLKNSVPYFPSGLSLD